MGKDLEIIPYEEEPVERTGKGKQELNAMCSDPCGFGPVTFFLCYKTEVSLREGPYKCLLKDARIKCQVKNITIFRKAYSVEST